LVHRAERDKMTAMGKRFQKRIRVVLPVRILGTDSSGNAFSEVGHTLDVNVTGVRLGRLSARVQLGDELTLQYKSNRARFLVRWVGSPRTAVEGQVGLECLDTARHLWPIPESPSDDHETHHGLQTPQSSQHEISRSVTERYPCSGSVEIRASRGQKGLVAKVSDISVDGCRVLTLAALPQDSVVVLLMRVGGVEIEANGVVRACFSGHGMGIQFTQFSSAADRERLQRLLAELRAQAAHSPASKAL
jgi:hypothetical protein